MKDLNNKVAAITGAASGIGRMLAVRLSELNCNLALADMNDAGLEETKALINGKVRVSTHRVDVSDEDAAKPAINPARVLERSKS